MTSRNIQDVGFWETCPGCKGAVSYIWEHCEPFVFGEGMRFKGCPTG